MSDEPRPMSQDEIDALFANLGKAPEPEAEAAAAAAVPADADADADATAGSLDQDAIDAMVAAGAADDDAAGGAMDQDAIDALLGALDNGAPEAAPPPPPADGPMDQYAIDALLGQMDGGAAEPEPASEAAGGVDGPMDQAAIDALLDQMDDGAAPESEPAPAPVDGPMDQAAIDALLGQMDGDAAPAAAPATADPVTATNGALSNSDIDQLLGDLNAGGDGGISELDQGGIDAIVNQMTNESPESAVADPVEDVGMSSAMSQSDIDSLLGDLNNGTAPAPAGDGPMGQGDIDALLNQMQDGGDAAAADPEATIAAPMSQDAVDTLVADLNEDAITGAILVGGAEDPANAMTQDDIDALLAGLDGEAPGTESIEGEGPATSAITPTKIERLMQKHDDEGDLEATGTGIIAQDDVDALLAQMNDATLAPDTEDIEDAIKNREEDIDALLQQADQDVAHTAADVVMPAAMPVAGAQVVAPLPAGAVMSAEEIRGSKVLLVIAVMLLMICAVTLMLVAQSINNLNYELHAGRTDAEEVKDDFTEALEVARAYLTDDDVDQVKRGVLYLEDMRRKREFKDREDDIGLELARHYRGKGTHRKAYREYQTINDRAEALWPDPLFYLEYADSLMACGQLDFAEGVIYQLIANQGFYTVAELPDGSQRDAVVLDRNKRTIHRAYVLLGELYNRRLDGVGGAAEEVSLATGGGAR